MTRHEVIKKMLITGFSKRMSRDQAITNAAIIKKLHDADVHIRLCLEEISETMIRDAINDIRSNNPFGVYYLVSAGKIGYWITNDKNEIEKWFESYYGRVQHMLPVIREARKYISSKKETEMSTLFPMDEMQNLLVLNNK